MSVNAEQIAAAVSGGGPYWWLTAEQTLYATTEHTPSDPADVYLLRASEAWVAQWDSDWTKAADQINAAITANDDATKG